MTSSKACDLSARGRNVLLFHHTHTPDSNRFEREVRGIHIDSHATDYIDIVARLPQGQDAIFVKTDHWKTDPEYFDRLESRLAKRGATLTRFHSHVHFELGRSQAVIINGVEAAIGKRQNHITICGLPLSDRKTYTTLDLDELRKIAAETGWVAPAHIGMPFHRITRPRMRRLCELATKPDIQIAIGYTTGYFPKYNVLSRNEIPTRISVRNYAEEFDVPLLPELDLHAVVPEGFSGCGVVENTVMDDLREGRIPVTDILEADLFRPEKCREGVTVAQFLQNYATFLPFMEGDVDHSSWFEHSLPKTEWLEEVDVGAETIVLP